MTETPGVYKAKVRMTKRQTAAAMAMQTPPQAQLPLAPDTGHANFEERSTAVFRAMRGRFFAEFRGNREYVTRLDDQAFERIVLAHVRRWLCPYQPGK